MFDPQMGLTKNKATCLRDGLEVRKREINQPPPLQILRRRRLITHPTHNTCNKHPTAALALRHMRANDTSSAKAISG